MPLRDDSFQAVRDFLTDRRSVWEEFAEGTSPDPGGSYQRLKEGRARFARFVKGSPHLQELLDHAASSDERLADLRSAIKPQPVAPEPAPAPGEGEPENEEIPAESAPS